jgi:NAD(P)-dependent dehydrogenase (short-subunit alcohol dehydrogenase family)
LFAERGFDIGLIARGSEGLTAAEREVELAGRGLAVPADVDDNKAIDDAANRIEEELAPIDVWANDAMATVFGPFVELGPRSFAGSSRSRPRFHQRHPRRAAADDSGRPRIIVQIGSALAYRGSRRTAREARDSRLHRIDPLRTDQPGQRDPRFRGPDAGG